MSIFSLTFSLFLVLNAIGNVPFFIGLLSKFNVQKQRRIIMRELLIALVILLLFTFFGDDILHYIGISQPVIGIAGGTLLFIIALGMVFPRNDEQQEMQRQEPFIVPLAIPIIAGPGAIATVMVYAEQLKNPWLLSAIIFMAWLPSAIILLAASNVKYFLGEKGLTALQRLGGMLIALIAVQMICSGAVDLIKAAFPLLCATPSPL